MGLVAAIYMAFSLRQTEMPIWPKETAIGSLLRYLSETDTKVFHPMNVNLGIFPRLDVKIRKKIERCQKVGERAMLFLEEFYKSYLK